MEKHHTITHIEIPAPDLAKAIGFYAAVFKWQTTIINPDLYAYFMIGDTQSGGGLDASLKPAPEKCGPQIVIDVEDIEETLQKIQEHGGAVTLPKTPIDGGHGFYAGFRDPNGNHMQIHAMK